MSDSLNPQDSSYLQEIFDEQTALRFGMLPNSVVDKLFAFAYAQAPVINVQIAYDRDQANDFKSPCFTYRIEIKQKIRYLLARWGINRGGILGKLVAVAMAKLGAPVGLQNYLRELASGYLPGQFQVKVEIYTIPLKSLPSAADAKPVSFR